jgi:hypothetical protein
VAYLLFVWIGSIAMTKGIFHAAAILSLGLTAVSVSVGEVDATTVLGGALGAMTNGLHRGHG